MFRADLRRLRRSRDLRDGIQILRCRLAREFSTSPRRPTIFPAKSIPANASSHSPAPRNWSTKMASARFTAAYNYSTRARGAAVDRFISERGLDPGIRTPPGPLSPLPEAGARRRIEAHGIAGERTRKLGEFQAVEARSAGDLSTTTSVINVVRARAQRIMEMGNAGDSDASR